MIPNIKMNILKFVIIAFISPYFLAHGDLVRLDGSNTNVIAPVEEAMLLTPPPPREPRINGPKVYGVRPGSPFLYRIPCTGNRPVSFRAEGLPEGLALDSSSGIISGRIAKPGTHRVVLFASNAFGEASE